MYASKVIFGCFLLVSVASAGPLERRFPPLSNCDTLFMMNGTWHGLHESTIPLFQDEEILRVHRPVRSGPVTEGGREVQVSYNENGRAVLQQQALRGCTAGVACMLIADHGKPIEVDHLVSTNLGDADTMVAAIRRAGLTPKVTPIRMSMRRLAALIAEDGSAIVGIGGEIGNHVIIVDEINYRRRTARIRDPYHGWDLTIALDALRRRVGTISTVIQVPKQ